MKSLTIDGETADRITVLTLKYHAQELQKELDLFNKGKIIQSDEVIGIYQRISAIELILKDFPKVQPDCPES